MKTFTHSLLGLFFAVTIGSAFVGCNSNSSDKDKELAELRQLAEMDRREMENQYADFAAQYGEMKKDIKDDSLVARLDAEQRRAENLLEELRNLKSNSAAEIMRLKKELETVRAVLRDYIRQVDSLQQLNIALTSERDEARAEVERARRVNNTISEENSQLSEKVAVAAQLNATGVTISANKKNGKDAKRSKDITRFTVSFTVTRNVTAKTGTRTVYVRLLKPSQEVVNKSGVFQYENKNIEYSAARSIEYTGEEQRVTLYVPVNEFLSAGTYSAYVFVDGQMIGSGSMSMSK
ncbi:MAG: hypothetical protein Q4E59_02150 [Bacteroidales bacterium]|nr:hypothetical protein [Bacteroidales bacterium]